MVKSSLGKRAKAETIAPSRVFTRVLRLPDVRRLSGLSRSTIYQKIADGEFPRPIQLSKRSVGWTDQSILDWIASRPITKGS